MKRGPAGLRAPRLSSVAARAWCNGCTRAFQALSTGSIPVARSSGEPRSWRRLRPVPGAWRSLVAHSAGGRKVAGSNPVAPTDRTFSRGTARGVSRWIIQPVRFWATFLAAAASAVGTAACGSSESKTSSTAGTAAAPCRSANLDKTVDFSIGAGNWYGRWTFRNKGTAACTLRSALGLKAFSPSGRLVARAQYGPKGRPTPTSRSPVEAKSLTLGPSQAGHLDLTWRNQCWRHIGIITRVEIILPSGGGIFSSRVPGPTAGRTYCIPPPDSEPGISVNGFSRAG